jgi:ATP-dependent DNA helicase RecG
MKISQIKTLISKGESETLEFKKSTGQLPSAFETICAFLNGKGGTVLVGAANDGKIVGQDVTDNTKKEIANHITKLEPAAQSYINIQYILVGNKYLIVFHVNKGSHMPYTYDGRAFQRNQSTTSRISQHAYEQLLVKRGQLNHSWEECVAEDLSFKDLDNELILHMVDLAIKRGRLSEGAIREKPIEILNKFDLLLEGKPKRAAVVLFCKSQSKQFIQSQLRLARFRGLDKKEFIDNKQLNGNLFYLYDQAITFLNNYLPVAGKITDESPIRKDTPAIPYQALREALVNALCHKDYSIKGGAVSLAIYDDRVEISSTGTLPNGLSVKGLLKTHNSMPRNPLIAKVFYACGLIERWGRGIQNIIEFYKEAGNPAPKFIATNVDFTVCLPMHEPIAFGVKKTSKKIILTPRQEEILGLLKKREPQSASEIFAKISNPPKLRTIKADLSYLMQQGFIETVGKGRNTTWRRKN